MINDYISTMEYGEKGESGSSEEWLGGGTPDVRRQAGRGPALPAGAHPQQG